MAHLQMQRGILRRVVLPLLFVVLISIISTIIAAYLRFHNTQEPLVYLFLDAWQMYHAAFANWPESAIGIPAVACCLVFGIFWHRNSGKRRLFYYILLAFFAFIVSPGSGYVTFALFGFRDAHAPAWFIRAFFVSWFLTVLGIICYEFQTRSWRTRSRQSN